VNPCLNGSKHSHLPFCDASLDLDERVADAVSRLTLPEKVGALSSSTIPLPSIGLPFYGWWSEGTHGISHVRNTNVTPAESNFALPITTGCAFNRTLWHATGKQIGLEARRNHEAHTQRPKTALGLPDGTEHTAAIALHLFRGALARA
jgi:hypothetical protein